MEDVKELKRDDLDDKEMKEKNVCSGREPAAGGEMPLINPEFVNSGELFRLLWEVIK